MHACSLVALVLVVALGTTPLPAFAADDAPRSNRGAVIGTIVGVGAGLIASLIYLKQGPCKYSDDVGNVFAECGLPSFAMTAGGGIAGYFIGHATDRPKESRPSNSTSAAAATLVPPVRLRQPASASRLPDKPYARLFIDAGGVP